jgi:putative flippase GtrA
MAVERGVSTDTDRFNSARWGRGIVSAVSRVTVGHRNEGGLYRAMISGERVPVTFASMWLLAQRFQKFLIVGAIGLAVNQLALWIFRGQLEMVLYVASPLAIFLSMIVTFTLNEVWTWHDRGTGPVIHRIGFYFPINMVGLLINYLILQLLVDHTGLHYLMANLVGAGVAAIWNFLVNNAITWRAIPPGGDSGAGQSKVGSQQRAIDDH